MQLSLCDTARYAEGFRAVEHHFKVVDSQGPNKALFISETMGGRESCYVYFGIIPLFSNERPDGLYQLVCLSHPGGRKGAGLGLSFSDCVLQHYG